MSEVLQPVSARSRTRIAALWFGLAGGPAAWFAQLMLGYFLWARDCYPGDQPVTSGGETALRHGVFVFDAIAVVITLAALAIPGTIWRATPRKSSDHFMALWGVLSSLCFLAAILFATVTSIGVPSCG
jgi:hypothetical protein